MVYVLAPTVDNAEAERVHGKITEVVEGFGGKLVKLDNWGRRKLAYPIQKNTRGVFVYTKYLGKPGVVAEIERNLRIADSVLRFQSTLVRDMVDPSEVAIDPEDLKFEPIVAPAEPEEELNLEQRLGLVPSAQRRREPEEEDVDVDDGSDDSDVAEEGGVR
jgi:small subunit ribosomal protein S6